VFARSTTIREGSRDPAAIDNVISYVRDELMPMLSDMKGCVGLSMMVDRDTGTCIATTSWTSKELMDASMDRLSPARARAADIMGGKPEVAEWEVAVMHREHEARDGSCCRVTWMEIDADGLDGLVKYYRSSVLPMLEELDGFASSSLFVDRMMGRACGTARYDDTDAMMASRDRTNAMRNMGEMSAGYRVTDVAEFELAIAHLRVPELV
jgi:hypothetical protein